MVGNPEDVWAVGDAYEPYIGRWSRIIAKEFLRWLAIAPGKRWAEVGSGTGALTQTILAEASPARVRASDASEGFVAYARAHVTDSRATFEVADARALPMGWGDADAVVSGLMLNFVPEPAGAVAEMARVARPGGVAAAYVWDYAEGMELLRRFWEAAAARDPESLELDEGRRFPNCRPEPLDTLFRDGGFTRVQTRAIDVPTVFRDFDDYWSPFLGGQGPAPTYAMSLSEEHRRRLRERLRETLPTEADGSIALKARAWAVRGTKPGL